MFHVQGNSGPVPTSLSSRTQELLIILVCAPSILPHSWSERAQLFEVSISVSSPQVSREASGPGPNLQSSLCRFRLALHPQSINFAPPERGAKRI